MSSTSFRNLWFVRLIPMSANGVNRWSIGKIAFTLLIKRFSFEDFVQHQNHKQQLKRCFVVWRDCRRWRSDFIPSAAYYQRRHQCSIMFPAAEVFTHHQFCNATTTTINKCIENACRSCRQRSLRSCRQSYQLTRCSFRQRNVYVSFRCTCFTGVLLSMHHNASFTQRLFLLTTFASMSQVLLWAVMVQRNFLFIIVSLLSL